MLRVAASVTPCVRCGRMGLDAGCVGGPARAHRALRRDMALSTLTLYRLVPIMKMTTLASIAAPGMANPMAQEICSWTYTMTIDAMREPMLTEK